MIRRIPVRNRMTTRRTKPIGTKPIAEEYAQVIHATEGHSVGKWLRDVRLWTGLDGMAAVGQ
jgi:hypothetical protein